MTIDFHTHAFPDMLAQKAIGVLTSNLTIDLKPVHNGTVSDLIARMDEWGIDKSVVAPIVTKPSQTKTLNEWAVSITSQRIISLGSIYPSTDNYKQDIDFVCSLGLKGLKFHAEYQNFILDAPEMLRIYDYALSRGLIILHHAGADYGMPAPYKSSPKQFANVADQMCGGIIVAAHLGGHAQWDDVFDNLCGKNIYLDTSMGFEYYGKEMFKKIVSKHGADKILFASDSPWSNAGDDLKALRDCGLDCDTISMIEAKNAQRILKI
ncbi:MAG: amidohydrolase [Ruminococcaceae bacterium]|nr:amidohydrolase [Oscillospiraceae bacterium]